MRKLAILITIISLLVACSNVKDKKFTKDNQDQVIEKVRKSKDLTGEESGLFMAALMRYAFSNESLDGKTVGQIISEQNKLSKEVEAKEKETKRLAAEAAKKEAQVAEELSKYIVAAPFKKTFHKADIYSGEYRDTISIAFVFENKSPKDIKAFKGTTVFNDLFGEKIRDIQLSYDGGLKAGQKKNWYGEIEYNNFISEHRKFKDTELNNMKFEWKPQVVIFTDGSSLGPDENPAKN
jgi:hypothetical protein